MCEEQDFAPFLETYKKKKALHINKSWEAHCAEKQRKLRNLIQTKKNTSLNISKGLFCYSF